MFHPILPQCDDDRAHFEIATSKNDLQQRLATDIYAFAYPNGSYSDRDVILVEGAGYRCALTLDPGGTPTRPRRSGCIACACPTTRARMNCSSRPVECGARWSRSWQTSARMARPGRGDSAPRMDELLFGAVMTMNAVRRMKFVQKITGNYLFRNSGITAALSGAGAVTGLALDAVVVFTFGVGYRTDAFFAAMTIPTLLNGILSIQSPRSSCRCSRSCSIERTPGRRGPFFAI